VALAYISADRHQTDDFRQSDIKPHLLSTKSVDKIVENLAAFNESTKNKGVSKKCTLFLKIPFIIYIQYVK